MIHLIMMSSTILCLNPLKQDATERVNTRPQCSEAGSFSQQNPRILSVGLLHNLYVLIYTYVSKFSCREHNMESNQANTRTQLDFPLWGLNKQQLIHDSVSPSDYGPLNWLGTSLTSKDHKWVFYFIQRRRWCPWRVRQLPWFTKWWSRRCGRR